MKPAPNLAVERYRIRTGALATSRVDGNNGAFELPSPTKGAGMLTLMVSDGAGWDHVSVSTPTRCPTWEEMCHVKDLFFGPEECVVQYHPPRSVYRNYHPFCLHLWRPQSEPAVPMPPALLVAPAPGQSFADVVREFVEAQR